MKLKKSRVNLILLNTIILLMKEKKEVLNLLLILVGVYRVGQNVMPLNGLIKKL